MSQTAPPTDPRAAAPPQPAQDLSHPQNLPHRGPVGAANSTADRTRPADRVIAIALAAVGALLMTAAAGSFIAVSWADFGLVTKGAVLATLTALALAVGSVFRPAAPGVASVFTHLGAALIPMDVATFALAVELDRAQVLLLAGATGLASFLLLDQPAVLSGRARTRGMAIGRILSILIVLLGVAELSGVHPALPLIAISVLLCVYGPSRWSSPSLRIETEALGLVLLAGSGPVVSWAADLSSAGSATVWLDGLTGASPAFTALLALAAGMAALLANRNWPGIVVAATVGVVAVPSVIAAFATHPERVVVLLAAAVLAARIVTRWLDLHRWSFHLDLFTFVTTGTTGLFALAHHEPTIDWPILTAAGLLIGSWILSDLESGRRLNPSQPFWSHLDVGATGPVSTAGIIANSLVAAITLGSPEPAAWLIFAIGSVIGFSRRTAATAIARVLLPLATLLAFGQPPLALTFGLSTALLLHARAALDLCRGDLPRRAAITNGIGLAALTLAVLRYSVDAGDWSLTNNLVAATVITVVLDLLAFSSLRWAVPDLVPIPRVLVPLAALPLLSHPTLAGLVACGAALGLFWDAHLLDQRGLRVRSAELSAAVAAWTGVVLIGAGQTIEAAEWYALGPAVGLLWFGWRAMRSGTSSWLGLTPSLALIGSAALAERVLGGAAWHSAVAGGLGLLTLAIGTERRWGGPTLTGGLLLLFAVAIEVLAVVPTVPAWVLLAAGGVLLLGAGFALERRAGQGATTSLRQVAAEFR